MMLFFREPSFCPLAAMNYLVKKSALFSCKRIFHHQITAVTRLTFLPASRFDGEDEESMDLVPSPREDVFASQSQVSPRLARELSLSGIQLRPDVFEACTLHY
jgi:hypothetical protein